MDPIANMSSTGASAMQDVSNTQSEFDSQFDRVLASMAQGVMSIVMEEMQQMASSEDE